MRAVGQSRSHERVAQRGGVSGGRARQDERQTGSPLQKPVDLLPSINQVQRRGGTNERTATRGVYKLVLLYRYLRLLEVSWGACASHGRGASSAVKCEP